MYATFFCAIFKEHYEKLNLIINLLTELDLVSQN